MAKEILLRAQNVCQEFKNKRNGTIVHAVNDVTLSVMKGETLALVGESGCGKTTLGRTLIRMLPAASGSIHFGGVDITRMSDREFRAVRPKLQMVFQDPYASLDPRMTVRDIIAEPLDTYRVCGTRRETTERVLQLMKDVGIQPEFINRYPHQFSGGQRQRIGIARAMALHPELIVCDEPVSALDVSVQSQVLNLLKDLQEELGLTYIFIGHDLSVIHFIADRVAVMFLGSICEIADKEQLYSDPQHPYTRFLLNAIPQPDPHRRDRERSIITGEVPSPVDLPSGCYFHTRCPYATEECMKQRPTLMDMGDGHMCACHHPGVFKA